MINVSLSELVLIVLALGVALVGMWWVIGVTGVKRAEIRKHKGVVMCRICGVHYEVEGEDISTCPACGTLNERKPVGEI
jgi:rRNA maturation endonuclease Nob1